MILAGEPGGSGPTAGRNSLLGQASQLVAGGGTLQRVTILEARPDATVVVQADYYPPAIEHLPQPGMAVAVANLSVPMRSVKTPARSNPIDLYLRTQRNQWDSRSAALLDVLA